MRRQKMDTKIAVILTILIMLVIGLVGYIVIDKLNNTEKTKTTEKKEETTTNKEEEKKETNETNNNTTTEETKQETTTTQTNSIPTESEIKTLMETFIKSHNSNVVDYRINSINLDSNTKEEKEMLNMNQDNILALIKYDVIRDGDGYTKEQGWIKSNQTHCILIKDTNGSYYVQKCGSGW